MATKTTTPSAFARWAAPVNEGYRYATHPTRPGYYQITRIQYAALLHVAREGSCTRPERKLRNRILVWVAAGLVQPSPFHKGGFEVTAEGWRYIARVRDAWAEDLCV
jgi:hypothetical protein